MESLHASAGSHDELVPELPGMLVKVPAVAGGPFTGTPWLLRPAILVIIRSMEILDCVSWT